MLKANKIPESVADEKARRILRVQHTIGMYDKDRVPGERNTKQHQAAARKIATEGVVLLKNRPVNNQVILPLKVSELKNVLVLGPNTDKKHGTGGGSSEVKSLYEITPLAGLKAALGEQVNIKVMRARSSKLTAIASDYVASRHWTGTPAWNVSYFADQARKTLLQQSWIVDSRFTSLQQAELEHITMTADIKPLKTGIHKLKVEANGGFQLKINGEVVISHQATGNNLSAISMSHDIELTENQTYKFEIQYDGDQHFILGWDAPGQLFTSEAEYIAAAKKADAVIYLVV